MIYFPRGIWSNESEIGDGVLNEVLALKDFRANFFF